MLTTLPSVVLVAETFSYPENVQETLSTVLVTQVSREACGFEATNRFFEIGSPQGLAALEHELRLRSAHQAGS